MRIAEEPLSSELAEEFMPLLFDHYDEIAHDKSVEMDIDWAAYFNVHKAGMLKIFTCRDAQDYLVGYAIFIVSPNLHYKKTIYAAQDIFFVKKEHRNSGIGFAIIRESEVLLKKMGVDVVHHHVKIKHDFSSLLEKEGYEFVEKVYTKRIS